MEGYVKKRCSRLSKSACRYSFIRCCSMLSIIVLPQKFRLNDIFSLKKNHVIGSIIPGRLVLKSPIWGIGCFFPDKIEPLVSLCSRAMKIVTGCDIGQKERDQIRLSGGLLCSPYPTPKNGKVRAAKRPSRMELSLSSNTAASLPAYDHYR